MEGMEHWKIEMQEWLQRGIEYAHQIPMLLLPCCFSPPCCS
ncbi:hypothetical protein NC651_021568 [Populus alba x Populus x berolinensis]|nr:hypothetical protein NC651_021568 [Populus alba x Populus x berolinensis]